MSAEAPNRRARLRAEAVAEIKQHALDQVAADGPDALTLSAIARAMGMSGPALYRYFASREDLLVVLATDAWNDLADALAAAAAAARRHAPVARFRAVTGAYRDWALEQPHRYRLALSTSYGSGQRAPDDTVPAAHRNMLVILDAVAELGPLPGASAGAHMKLDRQLERWAKDRSGREDLPATALELGLVTWTRLHGIVGLEIEGVFEAMRIDPALVYAAEVDHLLARHAALSGRGPDAP